MSLFTPPTLAADAPGIRNSWTRVALRRIRSFPDPRRHQILDTISRNAQNTIARLRSDDWLPAEYAVEVCDAIHGALGPEPTVEFWTEVVSDSYVGGLLEPLVNDLRYGGAAHMLDLAPKAWELSARNCGRVVLVAEAGRLQLAARELPQLVRDSMGIQAMFAGALRAMLGFTKLEAKVRVRTDSPDGAIAFELALR
jgi:hypothetical protein